MKDYYDKKKAEAVDILAAATGHAVENSKAGVHAALALALKEGTSRTAATAIMAASKWCWAHNETDEEAHKAEAAQVKK